MRHGGYRTIALFIGPAVAILTFLFVFPLLFMLVRSAIGPQGLTAEHYTALLRAETFWTALRNLGTFTIWSVLGHLAIGLVVALLVNVPLRGQKVFRWLVLMPWMLPPAVVATTWAWMFHSPFGVINPILEAVGFIERPVAWLSTLPTAMPAVLVANLWRGYPFVSIILLAGLQAIPRELYEAAAIDGAGALQRFVFVTLPLLKRAILIAGLLDLLGTVKYFELIWVMTRGGPANATEVLATYIYKLQFVLHRPSVAAALGVVMLLGLGLLTAVYLTVVFRDDDAVAGGIA
jgi:multiple sugar transport system permease protein